VNKVGVYRPKVLGAFIGMRAADLMFGQAFLTGLPARPRRHYVGQKLAATLRPISSHLASMARRQVDSPLPRRRSCGILMKVAELAHCVVHRIELAIRKAFGFECNNKIIQLRRDVSAASFLDTIGRTR